MALQLLPTTLKGFINLAKLVRLLAHPTTKKRNLFSFLSPAETGIMLKPPSLFSGYASGYLLPAHSF
jgi:hypothetical protein